MTKRDLLRRAKDLDVRLVRLQFNDIHGVTKNVAIPVAELEAALDDKVAFDGSCIEGFVRHEESDMYLAPDPRTFAVLWTPPGSPVEARLLCDVHNPDGSPFEGCTRSTLRRVLEEVTREGFSAQASAELEFFLFEHPKDGAATTFTTDRGSYFDLSPMDRGDVARCDAAMALQDMGIHVEATHHEVSHGQHEIDLNAPDVLGLADAIATARVVVKTVAARHNLHATFMPKPFTDQDGSGLHIAQRLMRDGKNAFHDAGAPNPGSLSETGLSYIGGLLAHARGFTAVTNPTVNSYKRLVAGYDAPAYIQWSLRAKSALIRVPQQALPEVSVELRSPDPLCNPYLALACVLKAGLDGVKRSLAPGDPVESPVTSLSDEERLNLGIEQLPASLQEAVFALDDDPLMRAALGDHSYHRLREAELAEWESYRTQVHPWEIEAYLSM
ncbi:MAG: type I glutamate--ammonia ligase [Candidatus Eremiobacter antarcticus]|nr:type I glutamate--ammonia ligase [Candidatus Eremiobacteraeota bacterium]MBC5807360.1 type I glutamate--ammonia ligase [Candidatus Eremiobacteraeota bacterium]PZR63113.1 MAG: type I glutamate--ammonia ligase [Candidatus Eremiobacter sp. RRmetagenome_bin22]